MKERDKEDEKDGAQANFAGSSPDSDPMDSSSLTKSQLLLRFNPLSSAEENKGTGRLKPTAVIDRHSSSEEERYATTVSAIVLPKS